MSITRSKLKTITIIAQFGKSSELKQVKVIIIFLIYKSLPSLLGISKMVVVTIVVVGSVVVSSVVVVVVVVVVLKIYF